MKSCKKNGKREFDGEKNAKRQAEKKSADSLEARKATKTPQSKPKSGSKQADFAEAEALFAAGGVTAEITEDKMNAEIAIHGSSPAIFFEMADRVMKYGSSIGLEEKDALQLFCQTMIGSAKMMLTDSRSPKELSRAVCSPGGTTLAMLDQLEKYRWLEGLEASFVACTRRAEELSGK